MSGSLRANIRILAREDSHTKVGGLSLPLVFWTFGPALSEFCTAIPWLSVDMVGDLCVSPIVPSKETLCPASPSLQWVPWASVPHLPAGDVPGIGTIVS